MILTYTEERHAPARQGEANKKFTIHKGINLDKYLDHSYGEQVFPPQKEGDEPFRFRNLSIRLNEKEKQAVEEQRKITQGRNTGSYEIIEVQKEVLITHNITDGDAIDAFFNWMEGYRVKLYVGEGQVKSEKTRYNHLTNEDLPKIVESKDTLEKQLFEQPS